MNRFISSCLLYLCLFISLSCGSSSKSVHSSTFRRLQQTEQNQNDLQNNRNHIHIITLTNTTNTTNTTSNPNNYFCGSSVDSAMSLCKPCPSGELFECMKYSHEFACIKGVDSCAHGNSAHNIPSPTPPTTRSPTKKYIPAPPDDSEESEIEKEATKIGWLFLYIVIIFAFIWVVIYYREAIFYFSRNVSIVCMFGAVLLQSHCLLIIPSFLCNFCIK